MTNARELQLAWLGSSVAALYFAWLGVTLSQAATMFASMLEGLGTEGPPITRFVLRHHVILFALFFGSAAVGVVLKERLLHDKRLSMMVTMLTVVLVRWVVDTVITVYYLPLFGLISKLT